MKRALVVLTMATLCMFSLAGTAASELVPHTIMASPLTNELAGGRISPEGEVKVVDGGSQTFVVLPSAGHRIAELRVDGVLAEECDDELGTCWPPSAYTFAACDRSHTITATFVPTVVNKETYTITAKPGTAANAGGRISPEGAVAVVAGGSQTFTVLPSVGNRIAELRVDGVLAEECDDELGTCAPARSYTFTAVDRTHTIDALFEPVITNTLPHTITAMPGTAANAGGRICPEGAVKVVNGQNQSFAILPSEGSRIAELRVDGVIAEECDDELGTCRPPSAYTFAACDRSHTIVATFEPLPAAKATYVITAGPGTQDNAGGRISPEGAVTVIEGGSQTFVVLPSEGNRIAALTVDGQAIDDCDDELGTCTPARSYNFTAVDRTHFITAAFEPLPAAKTPYAITASPGSNDGAGGLIVPEGAVSVTEGGSQTFTVIPAAGNRIASLTVDGQPIEDCDEELDTCMPARSYTFTAVDRTHTITAAFEPLPVAKIPYTINASPGAGEAAGGYISPEGAVSVAEGSSQTFLVVPDSGSEISALRVDGQTIEECDDMLDTCAPARSYTFTAVNGTHTIAATFAPKVTPLPVNFTIKALPLLVNRASAHGRISPAGETTVAAGGSQTYVIVPDKGYKIASVLVDENTADALAAQPVVECDEESSACAPPTTITFTGVSADKSIAATFASTALPAATPYPVTLTVVGPGRISPSGKLGVVEVKAGGSQSFYIIPDRRHLINELLVDGQLVEECDDEIDMCWIPDTVSFTNVTGPHSIKVTFQ